jgi:hypothetical protein
MFTANLASPLSESLIVKGDFSKADGPAFISGVSGSGRYTLDMALLNVGEDPAAMADAYVTYSDAAKTFGDGYVWDMPRQ